MTAADEIQRRGQQAHTPPPLPPLPPSLTSSLDRCSSLSPSICLNTFTTGGESPMEMSSTSNTRVAPGRGKEMWRRHKHNPDGVHPGSLLGYWVFYMATACFLTFIYSCVKMNVNVRYIHSKCYHNENVGAYGRLRWQINITYLTTPPLLLPYKLFRRKFPKSTCEDPGVKKINIDCCLFSFNPCFLNV